MNANDIHWLEQAIGIAARARAADSLERDRADRLCPQRNGAVRDRRAIARTPLLTMS